MSFRLTSCIRAAWMVAAFILPTVVPAVFAQSGDMPFTASKDAVALFKKALEKGENLEDTGTLFDQVVQKDPNFAFGYLFAGQNNREFQKNLETAVKLAPKASPGEREWIMSVWEANNGNSAASLAHLRQLLKLHPTDKRALGQMANFYLGSDDQTALKYLNESVKADKNYAPAYNSIGYANMALGRYADAESAFKTYIKLIPNNPNPYDSYAELLMRMGKYDESIRQYEMAISKDPTFIVSYRGIGDNYVFKGDYSKARENFQMLYDKATNGFNRNLALTSITNSWLSEGNTSKAIETIGQRIELAEKEGDVGGATGLHSLWGFVCAEVGDLNCASEQYAIAARMAEDPSLPAEQKENRKFFTHLNQVRLLAPKGDFQAARSELEAMRQYAASNTENVNVQNSLNFAMGYLELNQKNYEKAADHFSKANQTDPYVWYYQAMAYEGAGNTAKASALYKKIADYNQVDAAGYAIARRLAMAKVKK